MFIIKKKKENNLIIKIKRHKIPKKLKNLNLNLIKKENKQ